MPFFFALPLPPLQAPAPEPQAAQLVVTVRDIPGDPLEGAKLSLEGNQRGLVSATNSLGLASFGALPPGKYVLKASKEGYRALVQDVQLEAGTVRKLELRMVADPRPSKKP